MNTVHRRENIFLQLKQEAEAHKCSKKLATKLRRRRAESENSRREKNFRLMSGEKNNLLNDKNKLRQKIHLRFNTHRCELIIKKPKRLENSQILRKT